VPIYTRSGDDGYTYCVALGGRVPKDHPLIEFNGVLDEAVSAIGLARSLLPPEAGEADRDLEIIQRILFALAASVSRREGAPQKAVSVLESMVDKYFGEPLRHFILPGGSPAASAVHLARTLVRRAERRLVEASRLLPGGVHPSVLKVINRASDALFAIAVYIARRHGKGLERVDLSWDFLEGLGK
jgi:cob(I)alamin adenosyltransferase